MDQPRKPSIEKPSTDRPLDHLHDWDDDVRRRYPEPFKATDPNKKPEQFRDYRAKARPSVKEFHRLNHTHQTLDFVKQKKREFLTLDRRKMSDRDREMFAWVRKFNPYDLYTKSHGPKDVEALRPFYQDLVNEFFPSALDW